MTEKFQNKYRIKSARLQNWDYARNATYFVTICTQNREHYFGDITNGIMQLSEIGDMANKYWLEIPEHFPFVELSEFVVMPNHVHGIIIINKPNNEQSNDVCTNNECTVETRHALSLPQPQPQPQPQQQQQQQQQQQPQPQPQPQHKTIGHQRFQNQGKGSLSTIIGSYKSVLTKNARKIHADFAWQSRFHDHIIRNDESFYNISDYIKNNPAKWTDDKFYE